MSMRELENLLERADYWFRMWLMAGTEDERLSAHRTYDYLMDRAERAVKEGVQG